MDDLIINSKLTIPAADLEFAYSRSSGPGGQHVNKLNTRVQVSLNIRACEFLSDSQKEKLIRKLAGRISQQGDLSVTCQEHRSQHGNRAAACERMAELIRDALKPVKIRKKTKIPRAVIEKRLRQKKQTAEKKQHRSKQIDY